MNFYIVRKATGNRRAWYFYSKRKARKFAKRVNGTIEKSFSSGINFRNYRAMILNFLQMLFVISCWIATLFFAVIIC